MNGGGGVLSARMAEMTTQDAQKLFSCMYNSTVCLGQQPGPRELYSHLFRNRGEGFTCYIALHHETSARGSSWRHDREMELCIYSNL